MSEFKFDPALPPRAMADGFRKQGKPEMADMLLKMYERVVVNKEAAAKPADYDKQ